MKRLLLSLQCVVICCLAIYLSEGKGNAQSKPASIDGPTVIAQALEQTGVHGIQPGICCNSDLHAAHQLTVWRGGDRHIQFSVGSLSRIQGNRA